MGDELHLQSRIFDIFIRIDKGLHALKSLQLKFGLSLEFFNKILVRILLDVFFCLFGFITPLLMSLQLH